MNIEYMKPDELIPYAGNAKLHPADQVEHIANSIKMFGWTQPIVVDSDNVVVIGHGRLMAAKELRLDKVPVVRRDDLTEEQINACRLADNKTNESGWDFGKMEEELAQLAIDGIDMGQFGFEVGEDFEDHSQEVVEDEAPEVQEEAVAKLGQIYQLGRHRLMCGDSTDAEMVNNLMDGAKADMVFTDPPYGVSYEGGMQIEDGHIKSNGKQQIKNDSLGYDELYAMLIKAFTCIKENTIDRAGLYVFYAHSRSREFINAFYDSGLKQRSVLIWHKTSGGFGDFMAQYMNAYEPFIYGSNGDAVNLYGATNEKTVWDMDKEKKCDLHPTMKPIQLIARAIGNSSKIGDSVLDLFGGSGSTLIACEQTGRKCYMMELDPHYVDVIIKRWENLTGKKAVLLNDQE